MIIAYVSRSNLPVALALPDFIKSFHLSDVDGGTLNSAFLWPMPRCKFRPAGSSTVMASRALRHKFLVLVLSAGTVFVRSVSQLTMLRVILRVNSIRCSSIIESTA
jgi:hypothetical protein